jgi:hypothetical protein
MHKRDALKLRAGDYILYGSSANTLESIQADGFHWGRVLHVTSKGGIKIERLKPDGISSYGLEAWVPYHHVLRSENRDMHEQTHQAFKGPASGTVRF